VTEVEFVVEYPGLEVLKYPIEERDMKKELLLATGVLCLILAGPVLAGDKAIHCEELRKSIQRSLKGIKMGEEMMKSDPKMDTPDMQKALDQMKAKLAETRAELRAGGCGSEETADFMDLTHGEEFDSPCAKARAEIKATKAYLGLLEHSMAVDKDAGDLKRDREAKEMSLKHLKAQEGLAHKDCK
jgi:hypothetical protein